MTKKRIIVANLLLVAMVVAVALHLRATWDVAYARQYSSYLSRQILSLLANATDKERCPDMTELTVSGRIIDSSPRGVVFSSHGLLFSAQRNRANVPCSITIKVGQPGFYKQRVTMPLNGPMRMEKPVVTGGIFPVIKQQGHIGNVSNPALVYSVVLLVFLLVVAVLTKALRVELGAPPVLIASAAYLVIAALLSLWAARFDAYWLSPERVFSSVTALIIPASAIFAQILYFFVRIRIWKAIMIAVIPHVAAILASDFAILGF